MRALKECELDLIALQITSAWGQEHWKESRRKDQEGSRGQRIARGAYVFN